MLSSVPPSRSSSLAAQLGRLIGNLRRGKAPTSRTQWALLMCFVVTGLFVLSSVISALSGTETKLPTNTHSVAVSTFGAQGHPSKRHKELFRAEPILWPSKKAQQRQATVFVGIPSFRDSLCFRTVQSLFRKAKHPHRLRVGIYDQVDPHEGDVPCSHFVDVCNDENEKDRGAECDHIANVVIEEVGSSMATGVPTARYQMEKLLDNDSEFFVQVDAHTIFDPEWDTRMIAQWQNTENEFAVLTHYPNVADYSDDDYKRANSLSVLCGAKTKGAMNGFTKWSGQVAHEPTFF
ncbi:MAG: hypothetical protein MHM6MM_000897 [Cercozoa sp. M6MM]